MAALRHLFRLGKVGSLTLVCFCSVLSACSSGNQDDSPVSDSTLVEVLADLQLATARAQRYGDLPPAIRDTILVQHGLDSTRFKAAIKFYADHPDRYVELYTAVLNRLNESDIVE